MKFSKFVLIIILCSLIVIIACTSPPPQAPLKEKSIPQSSPAPLSPTQPNPATPPSTSPPATEKETAQTPSTSPSPLPQSTPSPTTASSSTKTASTKTVSILAKQWSFEPDTITVTQGDKVHLTITSKDVTHGFNIPEYNINEKINPGKTTEVEFVADKVGTFSFFCSVPCGKGHTGMTGQLIVQE